MAKEGSVAPKERVNIVYKPATGGAQAEIELPLKMMMLGDFTTRADATPLEERKTVQVDKDNFNDVMSQHKLGRHFNVPDKLIGEGRGGAARQSAVRHAEGLRAAGRSPGRSPSCRSCSSCARRSPRSRGRWPTSPVSARRSRSCSRTSPSASASCARWDWTSPREGRGGVKPGPVAVRSRGGSLRRTDPGPDAKRHDSGGPATEPGLPGTEGKRTHG